MHEQLKPHIIKCLQNVTLCLCDQPYKDEARKRFLRLKECERTSYLFQKNIYCSDWSKVEYQCLQAAVYHALNLFKDKTQYFDRAFHVEIEQYFIKQIVPDLIKEYIKAPYIKLPTVIQRIDKKIATLSPDKNKNNSTNKQNNQESCHTKSIYPIVNKSSQNNCHFFGKATVVILAPVVYAGIAAYLG